MIEKEGGQFSIQHDGVGRHPTSETAGLKDYRPKGKDTRQKSVQHVEL